MLMGQDIRHDRLGIDEGLLSKRCESEDRDPDAMSSRLCFLSGSPRSVCQGCSSDENKLWCSLTLSPL